MKYTNGLLQSWPIVLAMSATLSNSVRHHLLLISPQIYTVFEIISKGINKHKTWKHCSRIKVQWKKLTIIENIAQFRHWHSFEAKVISDPTSKTVASSGTHDSIGGKARAPTELHLSSSSSGIQKLLGIQLLPFISGHAGHFRLFPLIRRLQCDCN